MLNINKVRPQERSEYSIHCRQANACYDNLPTLAKQALKESLLGEQGYLCAYCMQRISAEKMRVEHFVCQDDIRNNPNGISDLEYSNLLACCQGSEGQGLKLEHCDVKKKNLPLSKNPSRTHDRVQESMSYSSNGKISSCDSVFNDELNKILNLNVEYLCNNRKAILLQIKKVLGRITGRVTNEQLERFLLNWNARNARHQLPEYAGVAISYLQSKRR